MKTLALAAAALLTATAVSAAEIGNTGISIGAELDTYYDFDAESMQSILTPTVGYSAWGLDFTAETELTMIENNTIVANKAFDDAIIELQAGYTLGSAFSARAYGGIDFDVNATEFTGAKVGVAFEF